MVYQNLQKVRSQWVMIVGVMAKTGETVWARGMMYKSVAQLVLLYGNYIWVVTGYMLKILEGFHHWAASRITGMMATCGSGREWVYPLLVAAMDATGLHTIGEYIRRLQVTIV